MSGGLIQVAAAWTREPLLHFFVLGSVLVGVDLWRHPLGVDASQTDGSIDLSDVAIPDEDASGRPLEPEQKQALVDAYLRSEVLVREARRLGLDEDDTIIRRRLIQKMEFLVEGLSRATPPDDAILEAWFEAHRSDYVQPAQVDFKQVFYSVDRRGHDTLAAARMGLADLARTPDVVPDGDPFLLPTHRRAQTESRMSRDFGPGFAAAVIALEPGIWSAPIRSSYGYHLVFVEEHRQDHLPEFGEIEERVLDDYLRDRSAELADAQIAELVERYEVEIR